MPSLKKITGGVSQFIPLQRGTTKIGRSPQCQLEVSSPVVSKLHAVIECDEEHCTLENKGINGTLVNGLRVNAISILNQGDQIQLGSSVFVFLQDESLESGSSIGTRTKLLQHVDGKSADSEESIRRQVVKSGSAVTRYEFEGSPGISLEKIRGCVSLQEQALPTLATTDSVRKLSQVLRFSESIRQYAQGGGIQCIFNSLHQLFPQSTQIVLATEFSPDMGSYRVLGASCRDGSESALICDDVIQRAASKCECLLVSDQWRDAPAEKPRLSTMGIISLLCVPMQTPGRNCCGVLQLIASTPNPEFDISDLERLAILAQLLTIVLPQA